MTTSTIKISGIDLAGMIGARVKKPSGDYTSHLAFCDSEKDARILKSFMAKWDIRAGISKRNQKIVWFIK